MTFLGGTSTVAALPNEAFVVESGTNATINKFSQSCDALDLTPLLAGVSGLTISDLSQYVTVTPGSHGTTNVTVNGSLNGSPTNATLVLGTSSSQTLNQLLNAGALILPPGTPNH